MARLSKGRLTLGRGTSVQAWSEGFFGAEYGKPLAHMREIVEIVRLVNAKAHTGELTTYEGKYHRHDWSQLQPLPAPVRTDIPIWIAALRGPLISLAAEIGDGVLGHPIWSIDWCVARMPDYPKRGLDRGGKHRSDIEFNVWLSVATTETPPQATHDARAHAPPRKPDPTRRTRESCRARRWHPPRHRSSRAT